MDDYDPYKQRPKPIRTPRHDPYANNTRKGNEQGSRAVYGGTVGPSSYMGDAVPSTYQQKIRLAWDHRVTRRTIRKGTCNNRLDQRTVPNRIRTRTHGRRTIRMIRHRISTVLGGKRPERAAEDNAHL